MLSVFQVRMLISSQVIPAKKFKFCYMCCYTGPHITSHTQLSQKL